MNYLSRIAAYLVIVSLSLSSLLFYSPSSIVFSAESDYSIEVTSPGPEAILDNPKAEFTGKIIGAVPLAENHQQIKVYEENAETMKRMEITDNDSLKVNGTGEWKYSKVFSEGLHKVIFVLEADSVKIAETPISFTIKSALAGSNSDEAANPKINSDKELPPNGTIKSENAVTEESVTVSPADASAINAETEATVSRPQVTGIKIIAPGSKGFPTDAEDMTNVPINASIQVTVNEIGKLTVPGEPLIVIPEMKTESIKSVEAEKGSNPIGEDGVYTLNFTPKEPLKYNTTYYVYVNPAISNETNGRIYARYIKFTTTSQNTAHDLHGNFTTNTNSCAACHSTHTGKSDTLLGGEFGSDPGKNLCMACHDGTTAPKPDKENTKHKHTALSGNASSNSCASCHNPHEAWSADNPNKIKDASPDKDLYPVNSYMKQDKATGKPEDFGLCFQCHNGDANKSKATNIEKYYKDKAFTEQSGHKITAEDGSSLNGQLTCSDCHETHGSNNIYMLKENLGNKPLSETDKFKTNTESWDILDERNFCLKCHTAKTPDMAKTELYGKKPLFNPNTSDHKVKSISCSECHGNGGDTIEEQFRSSAHAPLKLTQP
ncbi:cytochrome c3 family protein [Neobacillus notoginsengisoli]|nr:cytochrome c3 family protein [Neobacillus notoginsengisoli]